MRHCGRAWLTVFGCMVIWGSIWMQPISVQAMSTGVVVGGAGVNVRACPDLSCNVLDVLPLGTKVRIEGNSIDGFLPIRRNNLTGYAYELFIAKDGQPTPYLLQGKPGCNRIALIFDIGIGNDPDWSIIDTLQTENVPATMFIMGWWATAYPAYVQRLDDAGFVIGSHGDQRNELTRLSDEAVIRDIQQASQAILAATGNPPEPWFTAYAAATDNRVNALIARQGYLPVSRTVPAIDYGIDATADGVYNQVVSRVYDGAIVELHLDGPATANSTGIALPQIISTLRSQGYQFVTIPEMAVPCS